MKRDLVGAKNMTRRVICAKVNHISRIAAVVSCSGDVSLTTWVANVTLAQGTSQNQGSSHSAMEQADSGGEMKASLKTNTNWCTEKKSLKTEVSGDWNLAPVIKTESEFKCWGQWGQAMRSHSLAALSTGTNVYLLLLSVWLLDLCVFCCFLVRKDLL